MPLTDKELQTTCFISLVPKGVNLLALVSKFYSVGLSF